MTAPVVSRTIPLTVNCCAAAEMHDASSNVQAQAIQCLQSTVDRWPREGTRFLFPQENEHDGGGGSSPTKKSGYRIKEVWRKWYSRRRSYRSRSKRYRPPCSCATDSATFRNARPA
jgi:hypothetical protein